MVSKQVPPNQFIFFYPFANDETDDKHVVTSKNNKNFTFLITIWILRRFSVTNDLSSKPRHIILSIIDRQHFLIDVVH